MSEIALQREEPVLICAQFAMKAGHAKGLVKTEIFCF